MLEKFYKKDGELFNYIVSLPDDYKMGDLYPLIVFLHGAGERGENLEDIRKIALPKLYDKLSKKRVITLSPQCDTDKVWVSQVYAVKKLIDKVVSKYSVDVNRIALTGISMGGFGAYELAMDFPETFSCLVPICGGGSSWRAKNLAGIPVRAFHGELDPLVSVFYSRDMIEKVNDAGGHASLTVYPDLEHDCWTKVYEQTDAIDWMISQNRSDIST